MTHYKINMQIPHNHNFISNATQTEFLGLTIDDNLLWKLHIDQVIKRMPSGSYALRFIKYSETTKTRKIIYFAHILTIISYSIICWDNYLSSERYSYFKRKSLELLIIPDQGILVGIFSRTRK